MSAHGGPDLVSDGLVLDLDAGNVKSYPGTGTAWNDLSGVNGASLIVGTNAGSLCTNGVMSFNGADNVVRLPYTDAMLGSSAQALTMCLWFKNAGSAYTRLFTLNRTSGSSLMGMCANEAAGANVLGHLGFFTRSYDNTVHSWLTVNNNYQNVTTWLHMVAVVNGMTRTLYLNGASIATDSTIGLQLNYGGANYSALGAGPHPGYMQWFAGQMAIASLYNRALTAAEVLQNFNASRKRFGL